VKLKLTRRRILIVVFAGVGTRAIWSTASNRIDPRFVGTWRHVGDPKCVSFDGADGTFAVEFNGELGPIGPTKWLVRGGRWFVYSWPPGLINAFRRELFHLTGSARFIVGATVNSCEIEDCDDQIIRLRFAKSAPLILQRVLWPDQHKARTLGDLFGEAA
jgi:hypothetical protein